MGEPRVIKKYPNRRLYDTVESRYITLTDVRQLVLDRVDFSVIDKKTNADITQSILLQVIAEQETRHPGVLSREFLSQLIHQCVAAAQGAVAGARSRPDKDNAP
jgi:polyhydroxyalkanoate synthesis repressor PhaR